MVGEKENRINFKLYKHYNNIVQQITIKTEVRDFR